MTPAAKSVILDLLSSLRGRDMPVRALVAAGAVFGLSHESMRVALARLLQHGTVERSERGQYRIAQAAQPVQRHVVSWTSLEERVVPWRGGWVGVHTVDLARSDRPRWRRRQRALDFLGFRELARDLWVRPDNLRGGVDDVRAALYELGLEAEACVFAITNLDDATETRARGLWDAAALRRRYRDLDAALARSAARLGAMPALAAMAESFRIGGDVIRQLAIDPLLPEPLVPASERAGLVDSMRRYDRLGRACWRTFMQSHGAPHLHAPRTTADMRGSAHSAGGLV